MRSNVPRGYVLPRGVCISHKQLILRIDRFAESESGSLSTEVFFNFQLEVHLNRRIAVHAALYRLQPSGVIGSAV